MIALIAIIMLSGGVRAGASEIEGIFERRPLTLEYDGSWIGNGVCYGPHRDGQRPGGPNPDATEITEDLSLMTPHWRLLRLYGSSELAEIVLTSIRDGNFDMKVMLGAWIAPEAEDSNRREIEVAIRLANSFPDIVIAVSVGNETQVSWSDHRVPAPELIEYVRLVRAAVRIPVTVADDFNFWNKPEGRAVAVEVDFLTVHAHPMWNGLQLEEALPWLQETVTAVQSMYPEREVVIGETGWATSVHDQGEQSRLIKGRPGESEQKKFYEELRAWADTERQLMFFFEAFDENWKGGPHPAEVEKHWGSFRADRTAKAAVASER
jgi:exo-beta-1,3-glucanase (GH17 family)